MLGDTFLWFSKNILFGGKFEIAAIQIDYFGFVLISRDLDEILKIKTASVWVYCVLGDTFLSFKKAISSLAGKSKMAAVQTDHFRFSLIARQLDNIS